MLKVSVYQVEYSREAFNGDPSGMRTNLAKKSGVSDADLSMSGDIPYNKMTF